MSGTNEIKQRIESVRNTRKITNAMYLISSTKLQKAKARLAGSRPYFELIQNEIRRILVSVDEKSDSIYFASQPREGRRTALLVITSDKGLAGAYNSNIIKVAEEEVEKRGKDSITLLIIGDVAMRHFRRTDISIKDDFIYSGQDPTFHDAREISEELVRLFESDEVDEVEMIYSKHSNAGNPVILRETLLPLDESDYALKNADAERRRLKEVGRPGYGIEFYPSVDKVISTIMPTFIASCVFGALLENFCGEQSARMSAMSAANDNADELLKDLGVEYNRVRQAAITQEITEVAAGAKSQRAKKQRQSLSK